MLSLTSLLAFAALVAAQTVDPSIATPAAVVQCQPAQISFTATKTPVFISIIPGGQPSAAPLADLGQQNATPFTWNANIPSGTQITFQIRDSTGAVAYSAPVTIQPSSDSSCLGASGSASASSASQTASGSPSASSSAAVSASSSAASVSSSVAQSTSSVVASVSSSVASEVSTATAPATSSRATASSASTSRSAASATSATPSASTTPNSARSNMQVGFAGLIGLAAAVVIA